MKQPAPTFALILAISSTISLATGFSDVCEQTRLGHFDCVDSRIDNDDFASLLLSLPLNLTSLSVSTPDATFRNFFAMSQDFRRFSDMKILRINYGTIQKFGEDIFARKNSLEHLDISKNLISHVNQRTFSTTLHLKTLDLSRNKLGKTGLPSGVFAKLAKLETLNLAENGIRRISHSVFQGLKNLQILNLAGNPISRYADARLFTHTSNLLELNLNNCQIGTLPSDIFSFLPKLEKISLSKNPLKAFPHSALLPVATKLRNIDLSECKIAKIESHAFFDWSVRHLDLSKNRFSRGIDKNTFASSKIADLRLDGNGLSFDDLKSITVLAPRLQKLDISDNSLANISPNFFNKFTSLTDLSLSNIGLAKIHESLLKPLKSLRFLNISRNKISKIPHGHFSRIRLTTLDLRHNQLTSFPFLGLTPDIPHLYLSGNPWVCGCRTFAFQKFILEHMRKTNQSDAPSVRCFSPSDVSNRPIVNLSQNAIPTCSAIFGALGLSDRSEISILIAACGAVTLVLALISALACSHVLHKVKGQGRSPSKSTVSSETSGDSCAALQSSDILQRDVSSQGVAAALRSSDISHDSCTGLRSSDFSKRGVLSLAVAPVQPLAPEHKAFILEVEL